MRRYASFLPGQETHRRLPQSCSNQQWSDRIMSKNRIVVNGTTIEVEGSNVTIRSGTVYVDEVSICSVQDQEIHVYWHGDLAQLQAGGSVTCGDVHGNVTANGSVDCQDVAGRISSNGRVQAARAYNNINANGSVRISY